MIEYEFLEVGYKPVEKDIASINSLLGQLVTSEKVTVTRNGLLSVIEHSRLLVARTNPDGDIVGMATLCVIDIPSGRSGHIGDVVVEESFGGQGIGTELIEKIISEADRLELGKLDLTSSHKREKAHQLYLREGFNIRETVNFRRNLR